MGWSPEPAALPQLFARLQDFPRWVQTAGGLVSIAFIWWPVCAGWLIAGKLSLHGDFM